MRGRSINIPNVTPETRNAIVTRLADYGRVVEIGIGNQPAVARALAKTATVTATDIHECPVPAAVRFIRDDITNPDPLVYDGIDLLYALNFPPELHRAALAVATEQDAAFAFSTLGTDPPTIPVVPESLPGDTLFWARQ